MAESSATLLFETQRSDWRPGAWIPGSWVIGSDGGWFRYREKAGQSAKGVISYGNIRRARLQSQVENTNEFS